MPPSCRGSKPGDARTVAGRVPVDEDGSAKDAAEQIRLENFLRRSLGKAAAALHQNQFIAVVVTHELNLASELADELILMERGRNISIW